MRIEELGTRALGRAATVWSPSAGVRVRGGFVALHGASLPQRRQPIFAHLAATLTRQGFTVLTFDRRPWPDGATPLEGQAADALTATQLLQARIGAPVGLFGFSQGAWSASLAAADDRTVSSLVLVGCSGVSPAEQMRFYTDELLRRAGYGTTERDRLRQLRMSMEELLRGAGDRERAGRLLAAAVSRPWFDLAYLPRTLPESTDTWPDMDYDPEPAFSRVRCPTLLVYGDDEECVPAAASKDAWLHATRASGTPLAVVDLPGCGHFPAPGADGSSLDVAVTAFSSAYTSALQRWADAIAAGGPGRFDRTARGSGAGSAFPR